MSYTVRFIDSDALPSGLEFVFARQAGDTYLFVKQSAIDTKTGHCDALTRAWEVWESAEDATTRVTLRTFARAV